MKGFIELEICGERIALNTNFIVEVYEERKKTRYKTIVELRTHIQTISGVDYIVGETYDEIKQKIAEALQ